MTFQVKSQAAKKRFPYEGAFFALFLFLVGVLLLTLLGTAPRSALESVPVEPDPDDQWTPLAFAAWEGRVWLVCGGEEQGLLLRLDAAGQVESRRELPGPLRWAAFRGGALFLREDREDGTAFVTLDPETLQETVRRELGLPPQKLLLFDCGASGAAAFVASGSRNSLRILEPDGSEWVREFPEEMDFLAADGDQWLIGSGGALTVLGPEGERELPCLARVVGSLGDGLVLDSDGVVSRMDAAGLTPLLRSASAAFAPLSFCLDGENSLILSSAGGKVTRYDRDGSPLGEAVLERDALAVCGAGALIRKDGELRYAAFDFSGEDAAPPRESSEPPETTEAPAVAEGDYYLLAAGTTVRQLRGLLWPETADVRDRMGKQVSQGRLATGMTVNGRTLVVRGDCDGSGTVTQRDLRTAILLILGDRERDEAAFRAADLNDDGVLDGEDLLLFTQIIA